MVGGGFYKQGLLPARLVLGAAPVFIPRPSRGSVTCTLDGLMTPRSLGAVPLNRLPVQEEWLARAFQGQGWSEEPPIAPLTCLPRSVLSVTSNELEPEGKKQPPAGPSWPGEAKRGLKIELESSLRLLPGTEVLTAFYSGWRSLLSS